MLPSADLSATHGLQNNIPIGGNNTLLTANPASPWYSSLSLGISENLYDNGVSLTNLKASDLRRELANLNFLKSRDSLVLDVAAEFYRYSLHSALLEIRKQQLELLEKQFRTLASQYQQGFKTRTDYLRLKTQVQRAEIEVVSAQNNLDLSEAQLRKLLGVETGEPSPPQFARLPAQSDQKFEKLFPSQRPPLEKAYDYRLSQVQEKINDTNVSLVVRNYWPRVFFTSGITYSNLNYLNSNTPFTATNQLSWNALVTLQYNIWDWGERGRDVTIAEHTRDIQGNTIAQNLLDVDTQISSLMLDLSRIAKNYQLSYDLLKLEEEANRTLENQYREGKVAYLDLITSLNSLLDSRVQFTTSYFNALQAIARHHYFEGKLYEALTEN